MNRGGAGLGNGNSRSGIGKPDGFGERLADAERGGERGDDRIAGPGHVEHAVGFGADMQRLAAALEERHPGRPSRDQDGVDRDLLEDLPAGRFRCLVAVRPDAGELRQLVEIGRDQPRAGKDPCIGLLGIDQDGDARAACAGDQAGDGVGVEHPLGIVREDRRASLLERAGGFREDRSRDRRRHDMGLLGIDADQLVPAAQEPRLHRRRTARVTNETGVEMRQTAAEGDDLVGRGIIADDPRQCRPAAEHDDVGGNVARGADDRALAGMLEDRHRRFRRDTRDAALDVAVEKHVADDEDVGLCEALDDASIHVDLNRFPEFPESLAASPDRARIAADFNRLYADHAAIFERSQALLPAAAALAEAAISVLRSGGKLLLAGNGGSAGDSQHIATELTGRFETNRRALAAIALTTDSSILTAAANDFGFDQVFARQVEALGRPGDLFIGITTSGSSPNVMEALRVARANALATACLTGRHGGVIAAEHLADHCLIVPSEVTARIQEVHIFLGHLICAAVDSAFTG